VGDHSAAASTQERSPWAAVRRTLAAIVSAIAVINGVVAIVIDVLEPYNGHLPSWVFPALNGILVATALLATIVTRVLAMQKVNDWLREYLPLLAPEGKTQA
jgi:CHASE1-domain containing sensor protein